jgi:hypothetical protein
MTNVLTELLCGSARCSPILGITSGFADNPDGGGAIGLHYAVYREFLLDRH